MDRRTVRRIQLALFAIAWVAAYLYASGEDYKYATKTGEFTIKESTR